MVTASLLADAFARARAQRRVALIAYVVAGDPDIATTERVVAALSEAGVDCIELGIPYGDPLADGPTIARAAQRALAAGTSMRDVFALVTRATRAGCAPIVYFTYANPVDRFGVARFADAVAASGAAGALVPDVPLEETTALSAALRERGLALPLLVAPTTPPERARKICAAATGFVYVVSRVGVTGAKRRLPTWPRRPNAPPHYARKRRSRSPSASGSRRWRTCARSRPSRTARLSAAH